MLSEELGRQRQCLRRGTSVSWPLRGDQVTVLKVGLAVSDGMVWRLRDHVRGGARSIEGVKRSVGLVD